MLNITITEYTEFYDRFTVLVCDELNCATFVETIPATLLPYIAPDLCDQTEDLPFGLVGKEFSLKRP